MNRLKELRKDKKLTQVEFSKEIKIPYRTIQRWENGKSQIKPEKAQLIADYFNVSADYLLGRTDNPTIAGDSKEYSWQGKTLNVEEMASNVMMFGGRELTDEKKKIIQSIIEGYLKEAGD